MWEPSTRRGEFLKEIQHRAQKEEGVFDSAQLTVAPELVCSPDMKAQQSVAFVQRWQRLLQVAECAECTERVTVSGALKELSAAKQWDRFWKEAQEDIDRLKKPIAAHNVVVLNHAMLPYVDSRGESRFSSLAPADYEYLSNIRELLSGQYPSDTVSKVIFDEPLYCLSNSQQKLLDGVVDSVILTPYSQGGSLIAGQALREIGSEKRIFLAGAYAFDACLNTTAEELSRNGNEIFVVGDAALARRKPGKGAILASVSWEQIRATFRCQNISLINREEMKALLQGV